MSTQLIFFFEFSATEVPTLVIPGAEFDAADTRLHFETPDQRLHFDLNEEHAMIAIAPRQLAYMSEGDIDYIAVRCTKLLDAGEVITTVTPGTVTGLTLDMESVPNETAIIRGKATSIGHWFRFRIQGQTEAIGSYDIPIEFTTDGGRTLNREIPIRVV